MIVTPFRDPDASHPEQEGRAVKTFWGQHDPVSITGPLFINRLAFWGDDRTHQPDKVKIYE